MPDLAQSFKPGIYRKFTSSAVTIPRARTRNLDESLGIVRVPCRYGGTVTFFIQTFFIRYKVYT
jgi:hypothetical protein